MKEWTRCCCVCCGAYV